MPLGPYSRAFWRNASYPKKTRGLVGGYPILYISYMCYIYYINYIYHIDNIYYIFYSDYMHYTRMHYINYIYCIFCILLSIFSFLMAQKVMRKNCAHRYHLFHIYVNLVWCIKCVLFVIYAIPYCILYRYTYIYAIIYIYTGVYILRYIYIIFTYIFSGFFICERGIFSPERFGLLSAVLGVSPLVYRFFHVLHRCWVIFVYRSKPRRYLAKQKSAGKLATGPLFARILAKC